MVVVFGGTDVSGQGRQLEISEEADEIDVTTYGSDDKEFIPGMTERDGSLEVLDDDTSSTVRTALKPGTSGSLVWMPRGSVAGRPRLSVGTAHVRSRTLSYPYDDAVQLNCNIRLSGSVTEGTVS